MARAASKSVRRVNRPDDVAERILEAALLRAEDDGWGAVRLRDVAAQLDIPLDAVLDYYRDLDAVADAWFLRAWHAMLQPPPDGFADLPTPQRIETIILRWFDALSGHRRVTGEMLGAKMWYAHPHHWIPAIFNLSRTVQWIREVSLLDAGGRQRQIEEIGLTGLFLATLRVWVRDETEGQQKTRDFLRRRLASADRVMAVVATRRNKNSSTAGPAPNTQDPAT